jgi:allantoicase
MPTCRVGSDREFTVDVAAALAQGDAVCHRRLRGTVRPTFVRGQRVWDRVTCAAVSQWALSEPFVDLIDLASQRLGGAAVAANDEFFASKDRLVIADPPVWHEGEYTDRGKWMDGWESRRRRDVLPGEPGFDQVHDWCIVRLGARGIIRGVDVETTHFKGNFPESCALETCVMPGALKTLTVDDLDRAVWHGALERSVLRGDSHNLFDVAGADATHVRLNIFPDGGVARLRVYESCPIWSRFASPERSFLPLCFTVGELSVSSSCFSYRATA